MKQWSRRYKAVKTGGFAVPLLHRQCVCTACVMEDWECIDDRELQNWKGDRICITCQLFTYGVIRSAARSLAASSSVSSSQQGEDLLKRCEHWSTLLDHRSLAEVLVSGYSGGLVSH